MASVFETNYNEKIYSRSPNAQALWKLGSLKKKITSYCKSYLLNNSEKKEEMLKGNKVSVEKNQLQVIVLLIMFL